MANSSLSLSSNRRKPPSQVHLRKPASWIRFGWPLYLGHRVSRNIQKISIRVSQPPENFPVRGDSDPRQRQSSPLNTRDEPNTPQESRPRDPRRAVDADEQRPLCGNDHFTAKCEGCSQRSEFFLPDNIGFAESYRLAGEQHPARAHVAGFPNRWYASAIWLICVPNIGNTKFAFPRCCDRYSNPDNRVG